MTLSDQKAMLRATARDRRAAAHAAIGQSAGERILGAFLAGPGHGERHDTVSGYWPMRTEADPVPLLTHLHGAGAVCALPVVDARDGPLLFRRWQPNMDLEPGAYGEMIPGADAAVVTPSTLLVPLLAFDRDGHRLGYGGGYYDRTLIRLRGAGRVVAVGIAFSAQEVEGVPHDHTDQTLDWIVTESEAIRTGV